ncbi:gamma subclass chorismate mutase AroQ [Endozoicomonas sp. ALE010]|uniref:gamma subclass chorismate mutase AroQ n=1 Tax=Endozoicomonas sp. ALE010 TaxID=3403081 RepID=UPI003BB81679
MNQRKLLHPLNKGLESVNPVNQASTTISPTNSKYPPPSSVEDKKKPVKPLTDPDLMVNIKHSPKQCAQASDGTFQKVAITEQNRLVNSTGFTLQPDTPPETTPVTEVLPDKNQQLHGIFELINRRLTYMKDVALFKVRENRAVEDLTREKMVLKKAMCDAENAGLDPDSMKHFFQAQMNAAKAIQQGYIDQWSSARPANKKYRDLDSEVRPRLIELGKQIVSQISAYLYNGGKFDNNMQQDFVRLVNATHLSEDDKEKMFECLQRIRVI